MKNMFLLVKKNLKLLLRSKASALIVILGPLLVIFLAGMAFDNNKTYSISIGAYSSSYNELSTGFISGLEASSFRVTKYTGEEECVESIREGATHTCMVFSPEFQLGQNMNNEIVFYVDYSKINLVYMVLDTMAETIGGKSQELSLNLTTVLLDTIASTKKEVTDRKSTILTLTTKNDESGKKVAETKSRLDELDFTTELSSAAVTDLTSKKNEITSKTNDLEDAADDAIDEAKGIISDIEDEIEGSSLLQAEKDSILAMLNSSSAELGDIEEELETAKNGTSVKLAELNTAITSVSSGIEDAREKLESAAAAKSSSVASLSDAKKLIDEALQSIAQLQSSFNTIEGKISSITVTDASNIVNPVTTTIKPVASEGTHLNYIFPILIVIVIMFTGVLLSTTLIMIEKKTTAYFRNFISPAKDITFILSTFITCFLLLLVQVIIIIGLSAAFFGTQIFSTMPKTIPVLLMCMSFFTLAGMLIGYLFNSEETATLGAISLGSVFLFISDVILPLESMSAKLLEIAQYNPFVVGSSLLRKTIIHNLPFSSIEMEFLHFGLYCIGLFIVVVFVQSLTKKHYLSKYLTKISAKPDHVKDKKN